MEDTNFTLSEDINGPLLATAIGIEMVAGFFTNSFVLILTLCYLKAWKQPSNIFLTNMSLNYLIIVILLLPVSVITCATGEWIYGSTLSQKVIVCQAIGYIFSYCFLVVTESLALLSFDRFFFIVKALQYKKYMTVNKAVIIVAASWILAAFMSTPPLYGFGSFEFSQNNGICVPTVKDQLGFAIYGFIVVLTLIASIVVTSIWTYCYTRKYLKRRNDRKKYTNSVYISQKRRLIGLFGLLIALHVLCYSLLIIFVILDPFVPVSPRLYAASAVFTWLMMVLSPMAQSYFRHDIRNCVHSFLIKIGITKLQNTNTLTATNLTNNASASNLIEAVP